MIYSCKRVDRTVALLWASGLAELEAGSEARDGPILLRRPRNTSLRDSTKLKRFKWFAFTASMLRVYAVNALVFKALSCVHPRPCKARGHGHVAQPHGRSRTLQLRLRSAVAVSVFGVTFWCAGAGARARGVE